MLRGLRSQVWGIVRRVGWGALQAPRVLALSLSCPAGVDSLTPPGKEGVGVQTEYLTSLPTCGREAAETCPSEAEIGREQVWESSWAYRVGPWVAFPSVPPQALQQPTPPALSGRLGRSASG